MIVFRKKKQNKTKNKSPLITDILFKLESAKKKTNRQMDGHYQTHYAENRA